MTIIEVRGRGGQLVERVCCSKTEISIGRAFTNDVILEDPYVSAHHLRLRSEGDGWQVEDLGGANGTQFKRHSTAQEDRIKSGDQLRLGHTSINIYRENHRVERTLEIDSAEARLAVLGKHLLWPLLLALNCLLLIMTRYLHTYVEFEPLKIIQPTLWSIFGIVTLTVGWALLGRLTRHRAYFFAHFSIWLSYSLMLYLTQFSAELIAYNLNSALLQDILVKGLQLLLLALTLWASLSLATNLLTRSRQWSAIGLAGIVLLVTIAGEFQWQRKFSASPKYYAQIKGPALLWVNGQQQSELLRHVPDLLALAEEQVLQEDD